MSSDAYTTMIDLVASHVHAMAGDPSPHNVDKISKLLRVLLEANSVASTSTTCHTISKMEAPAPPAPPRVGKKITDEERRARHRERAREYRKKVAAQRLAGVRSMDDTGSQCAESVSCTSEGEEGIIEGPHIEDVE